MLGALAFAGYALLRANPEDLPWTPLSLEDPVGAFTGRKLARLEPGDCRALLDAAGIDYAALEPVGEGACRRAGNVRIARAATQIAFAPGPVAPSCPVAAALVLWEEQVVQPAALTHLGSPITGVTHYGTTNCRQVAGSGNWSEHATGNAIDIAGFTTANGRRITVAGGWNAPSGDSAFLRAVRDGSCDLFATVLSPDYNAAHADHFHLDQAGRGAMGYRLCR